MSSPKNLEYKKTSFLNKANSAFIEEMYVKFINKDPSLSALIIISDKIFAVSSSQPLDKSVLFAKLYISSRVKLFVFIYLIYSSINIFEANYITFFYSFYIIPY